MDELKKSMEGHLDSIEACLVRAHATYAADISSSRVHSSPRAQNFHDNNHITALEATCNKLQAANGLLRDKVCDLEGRSRRLNIRSQVPHVIYIYIYIYTHCIYIYIYIVTVCYCVLIGAVLCLLSYILDEHALLLVQASF